MSENLNIYVMGHRTIVTAHINSWSRL